MVGALLGLLIWAALLLGGRALVRRRQRLRQGCLVALMLTWVGACFMAAAFVLVLASA